MQISGGLFCSLSINYLYIRAESNAHHVCLIRTMSIIISNTVISDPITIKVMSFSSVTREDIFVHFFLRFFSFDSVLIETTEEEKVHG